LAKLDPGECYIGENSSKQVLIGRCVDIGFDKSRYEHGEVRARRAILSWPYDGNGTLWYIRLNSEDKVETTPYNTIHGVYRDDGEEMAFEKLPADFRVEKANLVY
jgi:hypothetical protein